MGGETERMVKRTRTCVMVDKYLKDLLTIQKEAPLYGDGVKTLAHFTEDGNIFIDLIWVPVGLRRQNIGTQVLDEYITLADATGKQIWLEASTDFSPAHVLYQFYIQAGFIAKPGNLFVYYPTV